jgi:hypothetical protein
LRPTTTNGMPAFVAALRPCKAHAAQAQHSIEGHQWGGAALDVHLLHPNCNTPCCSNAHNSGDA